MAALYPTGPPTSYTTPWDTILGKSYVAFYCSSHAMLGFYRFQASKDYFEFQAR
jgi:hypothetical protein